MFGVVLLKHRLHLVTLDPVVLEGLLWCEALLRVYYQTFLGQSNRHNHNSHRALFIFGGEKARHFIYLLRQSR